MQLAIHQQAVKVFMMNCFLKMTISGARTSRPDSRCFLRFSSQTGGSFTYLRTQTTLSAGRMPIHNMPRQPM